MPKNKRGQGEWSYTQRKDKLWTARKQFGKKSDGKANIKAFYGKSITEVKRKAQEYENQLATNKTEITNKTTLYEYLTNWLKTYKQISVKNTTYDGLEDAIEVRIKPYDIANIQLCNLSTQICQQYINELVNCDKKYSLATITKTYNLLNNCLSHAEGVGDISKNPMTFVNLPSPDNVQTPTKEITFFTKEEVALICEQARKKYSNGKPVYYYGEIIILLIYTGMRIGECLGLRWKDIDFENNTIKIDNTIATVTNRDKTSTKKTMVTDTSPKTKKSARIIPVSKTAKNALINFKELTTSSIDPESYIVVTQNGKLSNARNIRRTLDSILKGCGLYKINSNQSYGLHSLRHTFVSMLLAKGVDIKIISELVGHEKVSTTYDIYAHLIPEQKQQSVNLLDSDEDDN